MKDGYKKQVNSILSRPVTRAEFMRDIGVALVGMVGVTSLLRNLHSAGSGRRPAVAKMGKGYGDGAYGR